MLGIKKIIPQQFFSFPNAMSHYFNKMSAFEDYINTLKNNTRDF